MDFAALVANAVATERGLRFNDNTINECTIAGLLLKKNRKQATLSIIEFVIDKSVGKPAGKFSNGKPYDAGAAHIEGQLVSEVITLSEDWGPGKLQEALFKAMGITDKKAVDPAKLEALIRVAPRKGDLSPDGTNAIRGLKLRVELAPYETKKEATRFITTYGTIPQTKEELDANKARIDKLGIK